MPKPLDRSFAIACVCLALAACGSDEADAEPSTIDRALGENAAEVEAAIASPPLCTSDAQCRAFYLEVDRCGLSSSSYRIYSAANSNEQALRALQGERNQLATRRMELLNRTEPLPGAGCAGRAVTLPPVLVCRQQACASTVSGS